MKKDEILNASRKEHRNKDLAEMEVVYQAGSHASRVGVLVCCLLSLLSSVLAHTMIYSPWVISVSYTHLSPETPPNSLMPAAANAVCAPPPIPPQIKTSAFNALRTPANAPCPLPFVSTTSECTTFPSSTSLF